MNKLQWKLHEIIFESDTTLGKAFDVALLWSILLSVTFVILESVPSIERHFSLYLIIGEWFFTILFTIEYIARIYSVKKPMHYIKSYMGIIDLIAILPTYTGFFLEGSQVFLVVRIIRLLRIFRIFKLARYINEAGVLLKALKASRPKITVFFMGVFSLVIIMGSFMYLIEGEENGFTSIPLSIYWAIVTLTTVGYGDIAPKTVMGQFFSSIIMITGYAIIAVPTGIVTSEISREMRRDKPTTQACLRCMREGHDQDAFYCKYCGERLNPPD